MGTENGPLFVVWEETTVIDPIALTEWSLKVLDAAKAHAVEAACRGFSQEACEAMAVTFHSVLMASLYDEVDSPPEAE